MDLDRGILDMIEQYVADALETTGTRRTRMARGPLMAPAPIVPVVDLLEDDDDLIPIEVELEPATVFSSEEETAWMAPAFAPTPDPIPVLSRVRAARGSTPPSDLETEVELDDEITNLVGKPTP